MTDKEIHEVINKFYDASMKEMEEKYGDQRYAAMTGLLKFGLTHILACINLRNEQLCEETISLNFRQYL